MNWTNKYDRWSPTSLWSIWSVTIRTPWGRTASIWHPLSNWLRTVCWKSWWWHLMWPPNQICSGIARGPVGFGWPRCLVGVPTSHWSLNTSLHLRFISNSVACAWVPMGSICTLSISRKWGTLIASMELILVWVTRIAWGHLILIQSTWIAWMGSMLVSCWTLKPRNARRCLLPHSVACSMQTCGESSSTSRYGATIISIWISYWWVKACHGWWPCFRINRSCSHHICWASL